MPSKSLLRVDLHAHSWYSSDSYNAPRSLVQRARAAGLDRIAVTDHGAIEGALEAAAIDPELIIPGEEIRCACGVHVIGLFLAELIPVGLSLEETVRRIRAQGGVVYAPHPYAYLRSPAARAARILEVADVIEVFNGRAFIGAWNRRSAAAADRHGLPAAIGSDAHFGWEIGGTYMEMPAFTDARSFLAATADARPGALRVVSPLVHVASVTLQAARIALRRGNGVAPRLRR